MATKDTRLGGRPRTRLIQQVRARTPHPVCPLCGYGIDRNLPRQGKPHPLSSVIDEWFPRALGGDPHDPANCVELMRVCNGIKSDRWPVTDEMRAECRRRVDEILQAERDPVTRRHW